MSILNSILSLFGLSGTTEKVGNWVRKSKQIKISELSVVLNLLAQHKAEFEFIGIASQGTDCIYFVRDKDKFQIEFEVMTESQFPYLEKLKAFAAQKGYETETMTYGNTPRYDASEAPVLRILTNSDLEQTAEIAQQIQTRVFGNHAETIYDVVS